MQFITIRKVPAGLIDHAEETLKNEEKQYNP